ncbi:MAG: hypothetical protein B6A08_20635 [Sorangiineae bacterium NIC37A_2]|nr:MAG: hypothetical protein B6A08_20635 [Sorangiineae bacterium NIC37A_2]
MKSTNPESENRPLRSFLYVDHYKLSSISAQLFSGFTARITENSRRAKSENESQKGEFGSGRTLADETLEEIGRQETRFLHDFAYTELEAELERRGKLLTVSSETDPSTVDLDNSSFVRVVGPTSFLDLDALSDFVKGFNDFGEAITYATTMKEREEAATLAKAAMAGTKDRNQKAQVQARLKVLNNIKEQAKQKGLHQDPKTLESLSYLLRRGLGDHFEVQVRPDFGEDPMLFSALLQRDYLRERESDLAKKYGREAQKPFTLVGTITQRGGLQRPERPEAEIGHLRDAIQNLAMHLRNVEDTFFMPYDNEVVIDPVAVYCDL